MGNYATFYVSTRSGSPGEVAGDQATLAAKYLIPVCWLASVGTTELRHTEDEEDDDVTFDYFELSPKKALEYFKSRQSILNELVANLEQWSPSWVAFLLEQADRLVKVDVTEILDMSEDGQSKLTAALAMFENPSVERVHAFFSLTSLSDVYDRETMRVSDGQSMTSRLRADEYMVGVRRAAGGRLTNWWGQPL